MFLMENTLTDEELPRIEEIWKRHVEFSFNCVTIGEIFDSEIPKLIFGGVSGKVHILSSIESNEENSILETKGGPIQTLLLHDVTKFGMIDLIVGDSAGNLELFSRHTLLSRSQLQAEITCIIISEHYLVLVGDANGNVTCFSPPFLEVLWKLRVVDEKDAFVDDRGISDSSVSDPAIRCMLSCSINDQFGSRIHGLLLCYGKNSIRFYCHQSLIFSIETPSVVNTLCIGNFSIIPLARTCAKRRKLEIYSPKRNQMDNKDNEYHSLSSISKDSLQIVVGCEDGFIYIVEPSERRLKRWIDVGYPITKLVAIRVKPKRASGKRTVSNDVNESNENPHSTQTSMLLCCCGHFNGLKIFSGEKLFLEYKTSNWIHAIDTGDVDGDGEDEILIGTMESSQVQLMKVYL